MTKLTKAEAVGLAWTLEGKLLSKRVPEYEEEMIVVSAVALRTALGRALIELRLVEPD